MKEINKITKAISVATLGLASTAMAYASPTNELRQPLDKPNIIVLFADDLGYGDLGSYGSAMLQTPNIDKMAYEGQKWTNFYANSSICSPSRAGLLTGKSELRSGLYGKVTGVVMDNDPYGFPSDQKTIASVLNEVGYNTAILGKWHLGEEKHALPTRHGFDYFWGAPVSNDMSGVDVPSFADIFEGIFTGKLDRSEIANVWKVLDEQYKNPKEEYWALDLVESSLNNGKYKDSVVTHNLVQSSFTKDLTNNSIKYISENKDDPFFLYLAYAMPHVPLFTSEEFTGVSEGGPYGDAVAEIDWSVGKILESLKENGIDENTLVVFTSDNGPWHSVGREISGSAGPLKGGKNSVYEGGVRVPGIFYMPNTVQTGTVTGMGSILDYFETFAKLGGADTSKDETDSHDLTDTLIDKSKSARETFPYFYKGSLLAYRVGNYKLHMNRFDNNRMKSFPLEKAELYNLSLDQSESNNVIEQYPEVAEMIRKSAEKYLSSFEHKEPIFDQRYTLDGYEYTELEETDSNKGANYFE
ncbi:sulfatase family protein [Vibrio comitans]|uniref:Arylsulfatase n=1 Tax=Vibrio comitans NBRC 102076 TaxID=1219078 RepID=A0A4Y3IPC3_9VIBR|nr:sulfatase [Vibrio comitans]GEA60590.1 arylsulfatase [Vibrio comitans NBRC 102076]